MPPPRTKCCPSRSASGGAGCWATAPAAARAGRSPPSFSTGGCGVRSGHFGSRSPTSCWRTRAATGAPSAGREEDVIPLGKVRQGADIPHAEGILFTTYATLRSPARQGKRSRLDQIVAWLAGGEDHDQRHSFAGVIVFDEAHAMANAAGSKGSRGEVRPSQQGRAGLQAAERACLTPASSTSPPPAPPPSPASPMQGASVSGPPARRPFETRTAFVAVHGGRRGRRHGGGGARPQGPRSLSGPGTLLRRRGGRHPGTSRSRQSSGASTTPMPAPSRSSTPTSRRR